MLPFAEWRQLNIKQFPNGYRKEARKEYCRIKKQEEEKKMNLTPAINIECGVSSWSFPITTLPSYGSLGCTATPVAISPEMYGIKEEGNNPMNYATATVQAGTTETQDQRKYLTNRLQEVYSDKRDPLEAAFGLIDDDAPNDATELAERLKDGKFTIRTDRPGYYHWTDLLQWRHPDRKRDDEGFKAALQDLRSERQKALDIIKIDEPKVGLEAIKALEAWEPKGAAN